MGYIRHQAIVVTSDEEDLLRAARAEAIRLELKVTEIVTSGLNAFHSFLICPDGSKSGWPEDEAGDVARVAWKKWANEQVHDEGYTELGWVEVDYGGDDKDFVVILDHAEKGHES